MIEIHREHCVQSLLAERHINSYMHIFQLVKTLRAKINLVEWDRVRWSGQWQHMGSFFREGLSCSDVWAKTERDGTAIPQTSGEKCLRWKTQVQKLWWESSLHLRDSRRTGLVKANSERKPRHMVVGMKATWGLWPLFLQSWGPEESFELKRNIMPLISWVNHLATVQGSVYRLKSGWENEPVEGWCTTQVMEGATALPRPREQWRRHWKGGRFHSMCHQTGCESNKKKSLGWFQGLGVSKVLVMIRAGWCTVHKSRPHHWKHTHTHTLSFICLSLTLTLWLIQNA